MYLLKMGFFVSLGSFLLVALKDPIGVSTIMYVIVNLAILVPAICFVLFSYKRKAEIFLVRQGGDDSLISNCSLECAEKPRKKPSFKMSAFG